MPGILDKTAAALREMLLAGPVPDELIRTTPLFSEGPAAEGGYSGRPATGARRRPSGAYCSLSWRPTSRDATPGTAPASASPALCAPLGLHTPPYSRRCAEDPPLPFTSTPGLAARTRRRGRTPRPTCVLPRSRRPACQESRRAHSGGRPPSRGSCYLATMNSLAKWRRRRARRPSSCWRASRRSRR